MSKEVTLKEKVNNFIFQYENFNWGLSDPYVDLLIARIKELEDELNKRSEDEPKP